MASKARLVIVGAGIVGCSAAYHLAKLGWRDILVIDQGDLFENPGSTSHAPGGVVGLSHSKLLTRMAVYSAQLFRSLKPFREDRHTFNPVGGLEVAISEPRWQDLRRLHGEAQAFGVETRLLSPAETKERLPLLNEQAIVGSLYVDTSAIVAGWHVSGALARDAAENGAATFIGRTLATDIEVKNGRVSAVLTANPDLPRIECEQVLLCTNIWGPVLADKVGVSLPLMAFEHQYVITAPLPELANFDPANKDHEVTFPTVRELDSTMYYRQHWQSYGIGSYHHKPLLVHPRDVNESAMRAFTPADFSSAWEKAQHLLPALRGVELTKKFNGMFAFSVDGYPILGESHIKGLWTAVASWITHAGGVGKSIAEWLTHGETEWDLRQAHLHRFHGFQQTQTYIDLVTTKNYREVYDVVHPRQPLSEPRNIRLSPFHPRLQALQAEFTTFAGLELPNWFEANSQQLEKYRDRIPNRAGWEAEYWSPLQGVEHLATREQVALFDLTGLSIIELAGPGAAKFANYLCSNQMDRPAGSVIYTTWLTPQGGIKRDLAVARLASDRFWLFVGEGTRPQDLAWVKQHAPADGSVMVSDLSDGYTALGLWGPRARPLLSQVTPADLSNEAFPYFTSRWIDIGPVPVLALRLSYAGELGWELHLPIDSALPVWDKLWAAGQAFDLIAAGMSAFDSLRLEKGYRLWGGDIYTEYNPYEAGLGWTVKLNKGDFIGRQACQAVAGQPPQKKLCCLTLDDPQAVVLGYEPIFFNGNCVGHVTTANYGYSLGQTVAYGYLPGPYAQPGTPLEIEYFGRRLAATVRQEPLYDPAMARLKA